MKELKEYSKQELVQEVEKIRAERSGKGRVRRAASRTKRIDGQQRDKRRKEDVEKVESAEWV